MRISPPFSRLTLTCAATLAAASLPAQVRVALCGAAATANTACQWVDVQTRLQTTGLFAAVDIVNVTTSGVGTPTLASLLQYDALLCYTNVTPANNNTWGDVLADYVDAGGGVVVAVFANSTLTAGRNIGGRWQLGYEVILDQSGNAAGAGATLGTVHVPGHPSMAGVTTFSGGTIGSRPVGTALEVGATLIAEWSDGKVLIAQGASPRRIDVGFYPPQATCTQSGWATGGDLLLANSLLAVAGGAIFGPYGGGCSGSLGVPTWLAQPGSRPILGNTLNTDLNNVPLGIGLIALGFSNTTSGALTLPFDLSLIGMTGCSLLADPVAILVAAGVAPTVPWSLAVPANATLLGALIYGQGFMLDPPANPFGFTASNGARIKLGN